MDQLHISDLINIFSDSFMAFSPPVFVWHIHFLHYHIKMGSLGGKKKMGSLSRKVGKVQSQGSRINMSIFSFSSMLGQTLPHSNAMDFMMECPGSC